MPFKDPKKRRAYDRKRKRAARAKAKAAKPQTEAAARAADPNHRSVRGLPTPKQTATIALWLASGQRLYPALEEAGVATRSYRRWRRELPDIRNADELGQPLNQRQERLLEFFDIVERSEVRAEAGMVGQVVNAAKAAAAKGDWRAPLAVLERRFPDWQLRTGGASKLDESAEPNLLDDPIAALAERLDDQAERVRTANAVVEAAAQATAGDS